MLRGIQCIVINICKIECCRDHQVKDLLLRSFNENRGKASRYKEYVLSRTSGKDGSDGMFFFFLP